MIQQTFWYLTLIQYDHAFRESEHLEREQKESLKALIQQGRRA